MARRRRGSSAGRRLEHLCIITKKITGVFKTLMVKQCLYEAELLAAVNFVGPGVDAVDVFL